MGAGTLYTHVDGDSPVAASFNGNFIAINAAIWPANQGGLGLYSYLQGDLIGASGSTTLSRIAAAGYALLQSGGVSSLPVWNVNGIFQSTASHALGTSVAGTSDFITVASTYIVGTTLSGALLAIRPNITAATSSNASLLDISGDFTERGANTHPLFAGLAIQAIGVTDAAASLSRTASLYIAGSMTGGGTNDYALWVDDGISRVDAAVLGCIATFSGGALTSGGMTISTTSPILGASAPATPAANGGYKDNMAVAWMKIAAGTTDILSQFGVSAASSIGDGILRVTWAVPFTSGTSYAIAASLRHNVDAIDQVRPHVQTASASTAVIESMDVKPAGGANTNPAGGWNIMAIGI